MACPYYDSRKQMCKHSTQLVTLDRDRITQYCKGNYRNCPTHSSGSISYSWDERAKNNKARARGNNIRAVTPVVFIAVLVLCLFKLKAGFYASLGAAVFASLVVLVFTNKYQ